MHAFQLSRSLSRALVGEACLHVKGLSALLPEHKIGTGVMLESYCFFFSVVRQPEFSILHFYPTLSLPVVLFVCLACLLPVFFAGHLSIAHQLGYVF